MSKKQASHDMADHSYLDYRGGGAREGSCGDGWGETCRMVGLGGQSLITSGSGTITARTLAEGVYWPVRLSFHAITASVAKATSSLRPLIIVLTDGTQRSVVRHSSPLRRHTARGKRNRQHKDNCQPRILINVNVESFRFTVHAS